MDFAGNTVTVCSVVVGYRAADCIIFVAEKKPENVLEADRSLSKILKLDTNIMASYAGANEDARVVIVHARQTCLTNRFFEENPITVLEITKYIANYKQQHASRCEHCSFAVSLLIGGYDYNKTGHLCVTEPSGDYYEYICYAIGHNSRTVNLCLQKNISADASHDQESAIAAIIRSLLQANVTNELEVGVQKYNEPLKLLDPKIVEEMVKKVKRNV